MKQIALVEGFVKKHIDLSRNIAAAKMALISSIHPRANLSENLKIGATGILNAPLEYYIVVWSIPRLHVLNLHAF